MDDRACVRNWRVKNNGKDQRYLLHIRFRFGLGIHLIHISVILNIGKPVHMEPVSSIELVTIHGTYRVRSIVWVLEFDEDEPRTGFTPLDVILRL